MLAQKDAASSESVHAEECYPCLIRVPASASRIPLSRDIIPPDGHNTTGPQLNSENMVDQAIEPEAHS